MISIIKFANLIEISNIVPVIYACKRLHNSAVHQKSNKTSNGGVWFELSARQIELRDLARKFAREEILPRAAEYDRSMEFPWDLVKKAWKLGLVHKHIPKKFGGLGLNCLDDCIVMEELGYACSGIKDAISATELGTIPLLLAGNEEQKKKYFEKLLLPEPKLMAYCVTEPGVGSDVGGIKTSAVKKGDEYILNGQKMWITAVEAASFYFVLARTESDPKTPVSKAFTGFIVDRDFEGVILGRKEVNMGVRASGTRGITFEDVRVPKENVLLGEGSGFKVAMDTFDFSRPYAAASGVAVCKRAINEATNYALQRKAFGQTLLNHQAVAFMIAEMAIDVELSRLAYYKAAWEIEQGLKNTYQASIAKAYAGDAANKSAINAVQIFGANGYNTEYPVEKLMRDSKVCQIYEGTSQIQRLIIIKEHLNRVKMGLFN